MGNFQCCQKPPEKHQQSEDTLRQSRQNVQKFKAFQKNLPLISQQLSDLLAVKKPFKQKLQTISELSCVQYEGNLFLGETSNNIPNGFGTLYLEDGSVFVGNFEMGKPKGQFFQARPDGSFEEAQIDEGKIQTIYGEYCSQDFQYLGGIKNNLFHGKGKIIRPNYILEGQFLNGKLQKGKLKWKIRNHEYIYQGLFDSNLHMSGNGTLIQPFGFYKGEFRDNLKHGKGEYTYKNGNKYVGQYYRGEKKGRGEMFNKFGELIYSGQWVQNFPKTDLDRVLIEFCQYDCDKTYLRTDTLHSTCHNTDKS